MGYLISNVVYDSPEFKALCDKFGIPWSPKLEIMTLWFTDPPDEFLKFASNAKEYVCRVSHKSMDVYQSQEFQAFCKRFGIPWELRTTQLTITLADGNLMMVTQTYQGFVPEEKIGPAPLRICKPITCDNPFYPERD